jgi:penicillin G amidase
LFNWNNVPSQGWTTGDGPSKERLGGPIHRAAWLERRVMHAARAGGGYDATKRVDRFTGTYAQQRPLLASALKRARRGAHGHAAIVLGMILRWDGSYVRTDSNGTVDPGVATWRAFKAQAKTVALGRYVPGVDSLGNSAGNEHKFEVTSLESWSLRNLGRAGYRQAAARAYDDLVARFHTFRPSKWREERLPFNTESQGAGSFEMPFFDRGTWQQVVELGP